MCNYLTININFTPREKLFQLNVLAEDRILLELLVFLYIF